jgi:hypothetical protein
MAKGFSAVKAAAADVERRKNAGSTDFVPKKYLRLPGDGDKAVVRFLESGEDVVGAWFHQTPPSDNAPYGRLIPCIDQDMETGERVDKDCPGCEEGYKRKFQGVINVLWRDAPIFGEKANGKPDWNNVIGNEDQVVIWQSGVETFEELQVQDEDYGLSTRDFIVRRRGLKLNTKYSINPVDGGPTELSDADKELILGKFDLNEVITPPPYEFWGKSRARNDESEEEVTVSESPFASKRR